DHNSISVVPSLTQAPPEALHRVAKGAAVQRSAKRGLGIQEVQGRKHDDQGLIRAQTHTNQPLTRSDEDAMLAFDANGGVSEVRIETARAVLSDQMVRRLARAALRIKKIFGGRDQDIEWVYKEGLLYIVQSRPYLPGN